MPENEIFKEISSLETEQRNPASETIDLASTREILEIINSEDSRIPAAVAAEITNIETAVDHIVACFRAGGRLFYVGAGTSGRLGILDASECPPTFGTNPEMVQGIIAGGKEAVFRAQEGAEDRPENGAAEIIRAGVTSGDVVCGIAASGRTPFVKGALLQAGKTGAYTILVTTVPRSHAIELGAEADVYICPDVGPEVVTGSTRMKSGTAQKLVLNMLTTASMIRLGKTLGNVMVDLQQTNIKLKERSRRIIMMATGVDYDKAEETLGTTGGNVKTALVMIMAGVGFEKAKELLRQADGFVRIAVKLNENS